jgi:hypothetical protein
MNRREAKRRAAGLLSDAAYNMAHSASRGLGAADAARMANAFGELGDELRVRGAGDRGREATPPDPDQLPLLRNPCCDDTGFADYAATPCPNPRCTAVLRRMVESGQSISDEAQRLLDSERV